VFNFKQNTKIKQNRTFLKFSWQFCKKNAPKTDRKILFLCITVYLRTSVSKTHYGTNSPDSNSRLCPCLPLSSLFVLLTSELWSPHDVEAGGAHVMPEGRAGAFWLFATDWLYDGGGLLLLVTVISSGVSLVAEVWVRVPSTSGNGGVLGVSYIEL
jgi:hypothetical protein